MSLTDEQLAAACATFADELTSQEQIRLIREVFETREELFLRAWPAVVALGYGRRRQRAGDDPETSVDPTPCLTFVVETADSEPDPAADLPAFVFTYATVSGARRLCAIPTEIDPRVPDGAFELHDGADPSRIAVDTAGNDILADGVVTCAFTRSHFPDRIFAMSCRHVLSSETQRSELPQQFALDVVLRNDVRRKVAETLRIAGPLLDSPAISLDSQLMSVTEADEFVAALGEVRITGVVRDDDELDTLLIQAGDRDFWIHTSRGPVAVRYHRTVMGETLGGLRHRKMVRWMAVDPERVTKKGDSGSPVTTERSGGILVGMHQGAFPEPGSDRWIGASIPVVDLFDPTRYGQSSGDVWEVLEPGEVKGLSAGEAAEVPASTTSVAPFSPPTAAPATHDAAAWLPPLLTDHGYPDDQPRSVLWRLASDGIRINGTPAIGTVGPPKTVEGVWARFGDDIRAWATEYDVPVELIVATICTESRGKPEAIRTEPGYRSDQETPGRVSPGLMQTLISTARETLGKRGFGDTGGVDRTWLFVPRHSIRAGTSYIREQFERPGARSTRFDPPKVACAYNAGSLLSNDGAENRWQMKQYPIGSGMHADRFVEWFNDCFRLFEDSPAIRPSVFPGRVPSLFEQVASRR